MRKPTPVIGALATLAVLACAQHDTELRSQRFALADDEARAAFDVVYEVLQHPRCVNCHPAGDRPLQLDAGRPHEMNVVRGDDDGGVAGMRCAGCHFQENFDAAHMPPGVSTGWRLAPREMVFEGLDRVELAAMLLDRSRSHMTPDELLVHVAHDPLVKWGWNPGPGREPVPVPHEDFVAALRTWIEAGAPLPEIAREEED